MFSSARRLLRDDRYFWVWLCGRCFVLEASRERHRCGGSAGVEFLSRSAGWGAAGAVCVLQEAGDAGCGGGEVGEAAGTVVASDENPTHGGLIRGVGILRLRKDFASRSPYCAQDDNQELLGDYAAGDAVAGSA